MLAGLAPGAPSGVGPWDAVLRVAVGGVVPLVAWRATRGAALVAALAVALASAGSPVGWVAFAALGVATALCATRAEGPVKVTLVAAAVTQVALRLAWPNRSLGSALVAVGVLLPLLASGARHASPAALRVAGRTAKATLLVVGVATVLGGVALATTSARITSAAAGAEGGIDLLRDAKVGPAGQQLRSSAAQFRAARKRLDSWWARPALGVPVVGQQLRALREATSVGASLATAGARLSRDVDVESLRVERGVVPVKAIVALDGPFRSASAELARADAQVRRARSPWLLGSVADRLGDLQRRVGGARRGAELGVLAARAAPELFGENGPRRYFLAIETPAESRASGGIIGSYGEIVADEGHLSLTRLGRDADLNLAGDPSARRLDGPTDYVRRYGGFDPVRLWQNVPLSPDFPAVAEVIRQLYPQSGGSEIDGVISVDPIALAALLKLIGPVEVDGWPVPLTSSNAAAVLLHDHYVHFGDDPARVDFVSGAASTIWQRFIETRLPQPGVVAGAMGPAVRGRHLQLWSAHEEVQRLFAATGASGALVSVAGDALGVVTQNASGNKIDWFLQRSVDYGVRLDPADSTLEASLTIRLRNGAPASGLPDVVITGFEGVTPPGVNRTYLSVYTPWLLAEGGATLNDRPLVMTSEPEAGRVVHSAYVTIPSGATAVVRLDLRGRFPDRSAYRLDLSHQPTISPDRLRVAVRVLGRWETAGGRGWSRLDGAGADLAGTLSENRHTSLRIRPTKRLSAF